MNKPTLNAAVASLLLDDISRQFMNFHDDINDMQMNEDNYNVDLLLVKYFGSNLNAQQLPLIKAILISICEYTSLLCEAEDELDIEVEQMEFEF